MKKVVFLLSALVALCLHMKAANADCDCLMRYEVDVYTHYLWTRDKFDGDDAPFLRIRRNIDRMIAAGKSRTALAAAFKKSAQKADHDVQAQFRWAYAAWRAFVVEQDGRKRDELMCCVFDATGVYRHTNFKATNAALPNSYQYARLRLLIAMNSPRWKNNVNWAKLGKRLLQRDPNDYEFKYFLTRTLVGDATNLPDSTLGTKYAGEIQKKFPKRASSYSLLGEAYRSQFNWTFKSSFADKSILYYRKYLQMAPANAEFRKYAPAVIRGIEEDRKYMKSKGRLKP